MRSECRYTVLSNINCVPLAIKQEVIAREIEKKETAETIVKGYFKFQSSF